MTRLPVLVADRGEGGTGSTEPTSSTRLGRAPKYRRVLLVAVFASAFVIVGAAGVVRYVQTFWLYRGFPPPTRVAFVTTGHGRARHRVPVYAGTVSTVEFASPALGGRKMETLVYLPPRYAAEPGTHYPVLYLMHGDPGSPQQFVNVGDIATTADELIAEGRIRPMILVMPSGSPNFLTDEEWANSVLPHVDWETYVAHDLVDFVDGRYRTIERGSERGLAGLSEGGYGALNIGFHHVGEFDLLEAWSPYYVAATAPRFFGGKRALLTYNSPQDELPTVAAGLRAHDAYVWFYVANLSHRNRSSFKFAETLRSNHVAMKFMIDSGRHNWKLWRSHMAGALEVASSYFTHGAPKSSPLPPANA